MGLGVRAVSARRVSDEMFMAAAHVIGAAVPVSRRVIGAPLLPPLDADPSIEPGDRGCGRPHGG